jgi:hypothetical protein
MGFLYVSVKDTGVGMPKKEQSKLFNDFQTLQSNAHLNPNGVGLGLSICKKITNLLQGDIKVDSDLGKGSTFTFHVAVETNTEKKTLKIENTEQSVKSANFLGMTNLTEIPSDYSHLIERMQGVYKQFQTNESFVAMTTGVDKVLGPMAKIEIQNRRMLVVDD